MSPDARKIIVAENHCDTCGTERIVVFHQAFPELRIFGSSAEQAVQQLSGRLTSDLDFVTDPAHREPVGLAIADVQAFLDRERAGHPARDLY